MIIEGYGIIIAIKDFQENKQIIKCFSQKHGLISGMIRKNKKNPIYPGIIVQFTWQARLNEQLGYLKLETILSPYMHVFLLKECLMILSTSLTMLETLLKDRDIALDLFEAMYKLLRSFEKLNWRYSIQLYCLFEIALLKHLGFVIDTTKCAKTGTEHNLKYVSPSSGKAVSVDGAFGYEDRLLRMPNFIQKIDAYEEITDAEIKDGIKLVSFFIEKVLIKQYNLLAPTIRRSLYHYLYNPSTEL